MQRYRIFFPPEKFVPHSLIRFGRILYFFFHKKIRSCIFFSLERFESHSLEKKLLSAKKRSKNGKLANFRRFSNFGGVFFFSNIFLYFFFPGKVHISLTHSFSGSQKKNTAVEKKYTIFTHSLDFCPKMAKVKLFPGNKKIRYL